MLTYAMHLEQGQAHVRMIPANGSPAALWKAGRAVPGKLGSGSATVLGKDKHGYPAPSGGRGPRLGSDRSRVKPDSPGMAVWPWARC